MKLAQVFDPTERLLDGELQGDPLEAQGALPTYLIETLIKGGVYGVQRAVRLAAILAPLALSCCGKDPEEIQQSVQHDVRLAMDEAYRKPDQSCADAEELIKGVLEGRGYELASEGHLNSSDATILIDHYKDSLTVTAEDLNGHLIIMKSAHCKSENLQR